MFISLEEAEKDIKFGDVVTYSDATCLVVHGGDLAEWTDERNPHTVLLINLCRGKVENAFKCLRDLNDSSCELIARESDVELVPYKGVK